jgi:hypothetical protein
VQEVPDQRPHEKRYPGDLLEPFRKHIQSDLLYGFDFDATMLRIAAMKPQAARHRQPQYP